MTTTDQLPAASDAALTDPLAKAMALMRVIHINTARVLTLEADLNESMAVILSPRGEDAARLQGLIADAEHELELLCHPEWFATLKRVKTPFGAFQMQRVTSLAVPDQEATIRRIRRHGLGRALLRLRLEIKLECCEHLDDETLARLGIARKTEENFSVKPLKLDAGKAAATIKKNAAEEGGAS